MVLGTWVVVVGVVLVRMTTLVVEVTLVAARWWSGWEAIMGLVMMETVLGLVEATTILAVTTINLQILDP